MITHSPMDLPQVKQQLLLITTSYLKDNLTGQVPDNWDYRLIHSSSTTSLSDSTDYQVEAIQIANVCQPIHKSVQLTLCRGLYGLHIRRAEGVQKNATRKGKQMQTD